VKINTPVHKFEEKNHKYMGYTRYGKFH